MTKQYQDKEWLEKKYLEEELSIYRIAEICGVVHYTIWCWLKKFNISIRSRNEAAHLRQANYCNLSKEAFNWIQGELLGDGSMESSSSYSARFRYDSKYLEYIKYVSDILRSFGIQQSGKINRRYQKEINCYSYRYASLKYVELLSIYKKWYPEGKKIIPKNLKLTPLICKQWYIGDGCLIHQLGVKPYIRLATDGFTISNVNILVGQLNDLGFKVTRQLSNNRINISTYSTKDFLNYIGKCPVKCYQYKFAY